MNVNKKIYTLTISVDSVQSTDPNFTMDDLSLERNFTEIDAWFEDVNGNKTQRNYEKYKRKMSAQILPKLAFQIYEDKFSALSDQEKLEFPVCQYKKNGPIFKGIYPSLAEFKKQKNSSEHLIYTCKDGKQFVIYVWGIFSPILFIKECLKRFANEGDKFKLNYCSKNDQENIYSESGETAMNKIKINKNKIEDTINYYINNDFKQFILTGAPGTGKTYSVKKEFGKDPDKIAFVQFHPSYDYSDFVEGLRPVILKGGSNPTFVRIDGVFKAFCRKVVEDNLKKKGKDFKFFAALSENERYNKFEDTYIELEDSDNLDNYYFIIDEINRADLSKVFGELMYCLEDSYRGLQGESGKNLINTQYCNLPTYIVKNGEGEKLDFDCFKNGFFIPKNLYIIGTMNDIDRSVESFDFALRRRFEWIEIKANDVFFEGIKGILKLTDPEAEKVTERVIAMNEEISSNDNPFMLTEAYHIGHAYFKNYDPNNHDDSLKKIFDTNITSILKEYTRGRNSDDVKELLEKCGKALLG